VYQGTHRESDSKHGGLTTEYRIWSGMLSRCRNPNHEAWKYYGGRGIVVCDRWLKYENFLADMGRRPSFEYTLDRIDNDDGYYLENCRWATRSEQNKNQRHGPKRLIEFNGEVMGVKQWAEKLGLRPGLLRLRLWRGYPIHRVLGLPPTPVDEERREAQAWASMVWPE
jgi:hypothetical protein